MIVERTRTKIWLTVNVYSNWVTAKDRAFKGRHPNQKLTRAETEFIRTWHAHGWATGVLALIFRNQC